MWRPSASNRSILWRDTLLPLKEELKASSFLPFGSISVALEYLTAQPNSTAVKENEVITSSHQPCKNSKRPDSDGISVPHNDLTSTSAVKVSEDLSFLAQQLHMLQAQGQRYEADLKWI